MPSRLALLGCRARVARGILVTVEAFDSNCPQHINERYGREELRAVTTPVTARITELEAELERWRTP